MSRILFLAVFVLVFTIAPGRAEQIIVDEDNAEVLIGTWIGSCIFDGVHNLSVHERSVVITIAGKTYNRWAKLTTDNQVSWTSDVDVYKGNVYMYAWRDLRKFELFRMDDDTLLLEAKWEYAHPVAGLMEVTLQVRKSDYDRRLLKTGRGK